MSKSDADQQVTMSLGWRRALLLARLISAAGNTVDGLSYLEFVAPGLMAATALQTATGSNTLLGPILLSGGGNNRIGGSNNATLVLSGLISGAGNLEIRAADRHCRIEFSLHSRRLHLTAPS